MTRGMPVVPRSLEAALAVPVGLVSGVVGGMTGSQGIVIAIYLASLNLTRDEYVQGTGLSFLLTGVVWVAAIAANGGITVTTIQSGRADSRDRGWKDVWIRVGAGALKNKNNK